MRRGANARKVVSNRNRLPYKLHFPGQKTGAGPNGQGGNQPSWLAPGKDMNDPSPPKGGAQRTPTPGSGWPVLNRVPKLCLWGASGVFFFNRFNIKITFFFFCKNTQGSFFLL